MNTVNILDKFHITSKWRDNHPALHFFNYILIVIVNQ